MKPLSTFPLVSLVTVNYNGVVYTRDLLNSLRKISYPNIEVFVVDNASSESVDVLKDEFPEIILMKSPVNLGFAGGNNLAIKESKGKYVMLINNDTEVASDFLEPLVELMENNHEIGITSSKLIFSYAPDTIQYAGHSGINYYTSRGFAIAWRQKDEPKYSQAYPTNLGHGAAMMIRREAIEKVGLMAELYFLYYEETDFCERIKRAGFSIWFQGKSVVYHKESMSTGKFSPLKTYYLTRNRLIFVRRNTKGWKHYSCILFFYFIAFPKGLFNYLKKREYTLLQSFVKGALWNLWHFDIYKNEGLIHK